MTTEQIKAKNDFIWKFFERPKRRISSFFNREPNYKYFKRMARKWEGEIMLDHTSGIIRFIGWTDSFEEDYYWVFLKRNKKTGRPELVFSSCVGRPIRLKGRLPMFTYSMLDNEACLNMLSPEIGRDLLAIEIERSLIKKKFLHVF